MLENIITYTIIAISVYLIIIHSYRMISKNKGKTNEKIKDNYLRLSFYILFVLFALGMFFLLKYLFLKLFPEGNTHVILSGVIVLPIYFLLFMITSLAVIW